jgi:hypothetical protein
MSDGTKALVQYIAGMAAILSLSLAAWVVASYFECESFNRLTGRQDTARRATTWDAMFLELRIIDEIQE